MTISQERTEVLYELALAIGGEPTLEATVETALSAYLSKLDCDLGVVLERTGDATTNSYDPVGGIPSAYADDPTYQAARAALPADPEALPLVGDTEEGHYHVMDLPEYGVLVLVTRDHRVDTETLSALSELNEKLANSCRNRRVEDRLREERNRFEAVFETIQEPVVNVVYEDGEPQVERVNATFEETFGYTEAQLRGENVNDYIVPDDQETRNEATEIDRMSANREFVTREVRRKTVDGVGDFLLRSVPVDTAASDEQFGLYIDITEERARQRKLERLYRETEEILSGREPEHISERMVGTATDVFDSSLAGIYLYRRSADALVAAAVSQGVEDVFGGEPDPYTEGTVVWDTFQSGDPVKIDDMDAFQGAVPGGETPVESAMIFSLGEHGVFIVSSLETEAFDDVDFQFGRLLSTLVEVGLDRATRERGLEEVQTLVRETIDADDHESVAQFVVDQIPTELDLPLSGIWQYDEATGRLEPLATTDRAESLLGTMPAFDASNSIAGKAFARGETDLVTDIHEREEAYNPDSEIRSEIIAPLGEFGVFLTGSQRPDSFTETDRRIVETLAANLETVMRLVKRRQELELLDQVLARILRHNLRNDITVIKGFASTIEELSEGTVADQAERIVDRSTDLVATAEHAREMRAVVRSRDETVPVSLDHATRHAVDTVEDDHPDAEIHLDVEPVPDISAHPDLSTAIRHLVENGIEHNSPTGETPRVEVTVRATPESLVVEISDNGPGIPDGELEILNRHGESALEHGSGAGLWIVDRVVEYSDGALAFETDDGTTATIRFER